MPELPEVETIRRGLLPLLVGRRIVAVRIRERRLRSPIRPRVLSRIRGTTITGIRRRGKYLLVENDVGAILLVHLGMTGRLWIADVAQTVRPHEHVVFSLDDGNELRYADARRFGSLELLAAKGLHRHAGLSRLGVEPFDPVMTGDFLHAAARGRRTPVKSFLLDARAVAGVGNIYASESLHRAGLNPRRAVRRIAPAAWDRLAAAVRAVLSDAIRAGGTTLRDFVNAEERAGRFAVSLRVYDREGEPCGRCRTSIRRIVQAGRSTFYCPRCQR